MLLNSTYGSRSSKSIKIGDEETTKKFEEVKNYIGLKNDSEVLRFLLNKYIKEEIEYKGYIRADQLVKHGITEDEARYIAKKSNIDMEKIKAAIEAAEEKLMQLIQARAKQGEVCELEDDIRVLLNTAKILLRGEN